MLIRRFAGPFFVVAGVLHFVIPKTYESIVPDYLPAHRKLVYASGVAEIAGGAGLMCPDGVARRWAGRWLIATLIAVFPANLHMAMNPDRYATGIPGGRASLLLRLPFQLVFIRWVAAAMRSS
jgi:uncharacterized membrane protein